MNLLLLLKTSGSLNIFNQNTPGTQNPKQHLFRKAGSWLEWTCLGKILWLAMRLLMPSEVTAPVRMDKKRVPFFLKEQLCWSTNMLLDWCVRWRKSLPQPTWKLLASLGGTYIPFQGNCFVVTSFRLLQYYIHMMKIKVVEKFRN